MKTRIWISLLLAFGLAGCDRFPGSAPEAVPTIVLSGGAAPTQSPGAASPVGSGVAVSASGVAVPVSEARLASALAGRVEVVEVTAGDQVEAGQVLVRLAGGEGLRAALVVSASWNGLRQRFTRRRAGEQALRHRHGLSPGE
ncbi:MAG TPA: biotin/lipoyl-binding protein, partial [Anaerolineales bacterium]|nr:biotin/lipoyl-binding protein [Anaerolineales bacterium]